MFTGTRRVILDRSYSAFLPLYLQRMNGQPSSQSLGGAESPTARAVGAISWAALLFDKILIEDHFGTALRRLIGPDPEWFWDAFEIFSPDAALLEEGALASAIVESTREDLQDPGLRRVIRARMGSDYQTREARHRLILNINRTLRLARRLDAGILPAPDKSYIYEAKFELAATFVPRTSSYEVLRDIFAFEVPLFSPSSGALLMELRRDPRIRRLRAVVWNLAARDSSPADVASTIDAGKNALLERLRPKPATAMLRAAVSAPLPFPLNLALEAEQQVAQLRDVADYSWLLFLMDVRTGSVR